MISECGRTIRQFAALHEKAGTKHGFIFDCSQRDTVFKRKSRSFVHYESVRRIEYMRIITEVEE